MRILVSEDEKTFHSLEITELENSKQVENLIKRALLKKEKRSTPLDNPPQEEKKKGEPPLPPLTEPTKNLFGEVEQAKSLKKINSPPYQMIYGMAKTYFPDWNFRTTTDKRNRKIRKLWRANGKTSNVFEELFKLAKASDFLNSRNGHSFKGRFTLSWVIDRAEEILDGKYSNDRMSFALKEEKKVDAIVVGVGKMQVNPEKAKYIGDDEITGLPKYILNENETNNKNERR
jgi:hypothetical protein|tara:strand:+ start:804 stop:1496 length:693 start_codon:yes stop_codon:yes gene_type:complete